MKPWVCVDFCGDLGLGMVQSFNELKYRERKVGPELTKIVIVLLKYKAFIVCVGLGGGILSSIPAEGERERERGVGGNEMGISATVRGSSLMDRHPFISGNVFD